LLRLSYYNDGKEKSQSHEVTIADACPFYNSEYDIFSLNPFDITGYGSTKEEALENFKRKFDYVIREWCAFGKMLFETDVIENDIVEVDCFGKAAK
jgi:hypothetical protein